MKISKKLEEFLNYLDVYEREINMRTTDLKPGYARIKTTVRTLIKSSLLYESLFDEKQQEIDKIKLYYTNIVQKRDKTIEKLRKTVKKTKSYKMSLPEI